MITVLPVPAFRDNYIWFIIHEPDKKAAIVDPGDAGPVFDYIDKHGVVPSAILVTHHHPDHVGGIDRILTRYDIPVYGPVNESIPNRTHALKEGDILEMPDFGIKFNILDMPGHTAGAIAFHCEGMVFVGDTLFLSGCGRLFEGTPAQMHSSLGKLGSLPDDTKIYCAHEYTLANLSFARAVEPENTNIHQRISECETLRERNIPTVPGILSTEKLVNPFLRVNVDAVVRAACKHTGTSLKGEVEVFAAIRQWKDNF